MRKFTNVEVLPGYRLALAFDDGTRGVVDLSELVGNGVFAAWSDYAVFEQVRMDESGALEWPGGIDVCPDALYLKITGRTPEDVFPSLQRQSHA